MNEFPHSRMFDSDLREILEMFQSIKSLPDEWENFKENIKKQLSSLIASNYIDEILKAISRVHIKFEQFGAVGDGVTDDTMAIKDCLEYSAENGNPILSTGVYKISDTLLIDGTKIKSIICSGLIKPTFNNKDVVVIEKTNIEGVYEFHVDGIDEFGPTFNFDNFEDFNYGEITNKAIVLRNCMHSKFNLTARYCGVGVSVEGVGNAGNEGGTAYNTINITNISNCVIGLDLMAKNGGWVNENSFPNLSIQDYSNFKLGRNKAIGVRIWCNNSEHIPNDNVFDKSCFQVTGLPIYIMSGQWNLFNNIRCESTTRDIEYYVKFSGKAAENRFSVLYGSISGIKFFYENSGTPWKNYLTSLNKENAGNLINTFSWRFDSSDFVGLGSVMYSRYLDAITPYDFKLKNEPSQYLACNVTENGLTSKANTIIGVLVELSPNKDFYSIVHATNADVRMNWVCLDENFQPVNITKYDFDGSSIYGSPATAQIENINNIPILSSPSDVNHKLEYLKVLREDVKYVFCGVKNISGFYALDIYDNDNGTLSNIYTKSRVIKQQNGLDKISINDTSLIELPFKGRYIPIVNGETTGESVVTGVYCTDGVNWIKLSMTRH